MKGTIYVLRCEEDLVVKIGKTTKPLITRVSNWNKSRGPLYLIGAFQSEDVDADEREVLSWFTDRLVRGKEWFGGFGDGDLERIAAFFNAPDGWQESLPNLPDRRIAHPVVCKRCGHKWNTKHERPDKCYMCKTLDWDVNRMCKCGRVMVPATKLEPGNFSTPKLRCSNRRCKQNIWNRPKKSKA
jgi:hypothetical protein